MVRSFFAGAAALFALISLTHPLAAQQLAMPPLSAYGKLPDVDLVALSPSGKRTAAVMHLNDDQLLLILDDANEPVYKSSLGDVKIRSVEFASDDHLIIVRSETSILDRTFVQDQAELSQAMVLTISTGEVEAVFSDLSKLGKTVHGFYGIRMMDGRPNAIFGALESKWSDKDLSYYFEDGLPELYAFDVTTGKSAKIATSARLGYWRDWAVAPDGSVLAFMDFSTSSGKWTLRNGQDAEIAEGKAPTGNVGILGTGKDTDHVWFYVEDAEEEITRWYEVPVVGAVQPKEIFADQGIARLYRDALTGVVLGYRPEGDNAPPVFFDPVQEQRAKQLFKAFPEMNPVLSDSTSGLDYALVHTSGNKDSGSYFRVDLAQKRAAAIAYERDEIGPDQVGPIASFAYKAGDGLDLDGILTLPPGRDAQNLPLVVLPHGGPHSHDTPTFDWWAQAFASRGYAVFQPNFRGSTNRDEAFVRMGYGEWGGKMQTDISDGVAALAAEGMIDPKRACIVGASYGGYAALAGVTMQHDLYRCAVSVAGVSDLSLMSRTERREGGDTKVGNRALGKQLGPSSRYRELSPRFHAEEADAPVLLMHGEADTVVLFEQSAKMADALKDAGKPFELVTLEGEDHWLSLAATRQLMLYKAVGFVERYNPPQ